MAQKNCFQVDIQGGFKLFVKGSLRKTDFWIVFPGCEKVKFDSNHVAAGQHATTTVTTDPALTLQNDKTSDSSGRFISYDGSYPMVPAPDGS